MEESKNQVKIKRPLRKRILRWILVPIILLLLIFSGVFIWVYTNQSELTKNVLSEINKDFKGKMSIENVDISLFENFPFVSIVLKDFKLHESNNTDNEIITVGSLYTGFDLWEMTNDKYVVRKMKLANATLHAEIDSNNNLNLLKAFEPVKQRIEEDTTSSGNVNFQLEEVEFENVNVEYKDINGNQYHSFTIEKLETDVSLIDEKLSNKLYLKLKLSEANDLVGSDYFNGKIVELTSDIYLDLLNNNLQINKGQLEFDKGVYAVKGSLDIEKLFGDLDFVGETNNLEIIKSYLPEELAKPYKLHKTKGNVIVGAKLNGNLTVQPTFSINVNLNDIAVLDPYNKSNLTHLSGNINAESGADGDFSKGYVTLNGVEIKLNEDVIRLSGRVDNLENPILDLDLFSSVEIENIQSYYPIKGLKDLKGKISIGSTIDKIDLSKNSDAITYDFIKKGNTYVQIENVNVPLDGFANNLTLLGGKVHIDNGSLSIKELKTKIGKSDIDIDFNLNNTAAFILDNKKEVNGSININSNNLELNKLLSFDTSLVKQYSDVLKSVNLNFDFKSTASDLLNTEGIPTGNYNLNNISFTGSNWHHTLKKLSSSVSVSNHDIELHNFDVIIDNSELFVEAIVQNYDAYFKPRLNKLIEANLSIESDHFNFNDIFDLKSGTSVAEEYKNEKVDDFKFKFNGSINSVEMLRETKLIPNFKFLITQLEGKLSAHPLAFKDFNVDISVDDQDIYINNFTGKIGENDFTLKGTFIKPLDWGFPFTNRNKEYIYLKANRLNFNELLSFGSEDFEKRVEEQKNRTKEERLERRKNKEQPFNILDMPFPSMKLDIDIKDMVYEKAEVTDFQLKISSSKEDREAIIEQLSLKVAGGTISTSTNKRVPVNKFVAKNKENIYLSTAIETGSLNISDVLFVLDNIGQDYISNRNLTGKINGISNLEKIYFDEQLNIDLNHLNFIGGPQLTNGNLKDFELISKYLGSILKRTDLSNIKYDTINGRYEIVDGVMNIKRKMTIKSTLGTFQLKGKYGITDEHNGDMDVVVDIPSKMIANVMGEMASSGKNKSDEIKDYSTRRSSTVHIISYEEKMYYKIYLKNTSLFTIEENKKKKGIDKFLKAYTLVED